jgi:hypothetical protein
MLRTGVAFVIAPWGASILTAGVLSVWQNFQFDHGIFWFYLTWLGIFGQIIAIFVCAPLYIVALRLTKMSFIKTVIAAGLAVGGSVGLLSLVASSQGIRSVGSYGMDLISGSIAFGLMGAIGGVIFYWIAPRFEDRNGRRKSEKLSGAY